MRFRGYQWEAVTSIWNYFGEGNTGNPVVVMPTGTGKSLVIGGFVRLVYDHYPNQRVMMLTHVKELIEQNHEKLLAIWPNAPAGIYSAGLKQKNHYNSITFAGIGSVVKNADLFGHIDLLMIDEAHLVSPSDTTMYQKFIGQLMEVNPNLKTIGLTATPYRLGHGRIIDEGSIFTDICYDLSTPEKFNWLISEGYLLPLVPRKTELALNVDGVHKRGGEFISKELQNAVDKYEITESAVKEALEHGADRNCWLVFTAGVEHAIHTAEILNAYGVSAIAVHGGNKEYKMTDGERDAAIAKFKRGEVQCLVNNNILTTGFDHPPIDLILMLRPTSSPGLWVQMLGRGTRPVYADGFDLETTEGRLAAIEASGTKDCLVLDFGGNTRRLGPINDPLLPAKKGKKGGTAPIKLCEGITQDNKTCNTWVHASVRECPHCGNEFRFQTQIKQTASTEDLVKGDLPVVEEFKIEHITYSLHEKQGRPPMMKVSYYCGYQMFTEYVCFEHDGFAKHKAHKWWRERTDAPVPEKTSDALSRTGVLGTSTSLRVWVNKKYPEIMAHCYDGTHFGKEEGGAEPTTDNSYLPPPASQQPADDWDDDIPF